MKLSDKARSYIGFAVKAGKVKYGYDNIEGARKPPKLILMYSGCAERTLKSTAAYAEKSSCPLIVIDELPVKGRDCKVLGVYEQELAKAIIVDCERKGEIECPKKV
jgi:ribosomal protein L7Ae-like RNA K-turn-binding protein